MKGWFNQFKGSIDVICYEELVNNPVTEMKSALSLLELDEPRNPASQKPVN